MERTIRVVKHLKGPVVPVNTCFGDDDSLDVGAMRKYVNWLCEQNIPVILLTYGSSEFCSLTDEEIWRLGFTLRDSGTARSIKGVWQSQTETLIRRNSSDARHHGLGKNELAFSRLQRNRIGLSWN